MTGLTEIFWFEQAAAPLLLVAPNPAAGRFGGRFYAPRAVDRGTGRQALRVGRTAACRLATSRIQPLSPALQLAERFEPLAYHVAVDGLSLVFLLLAALLTLLMTLYGMSRGMISPGRLFAVLLLAEAGLVGMLVTVNIAWFAAFSALSCGR